MYRVKFFARNVGNQKHSWRDVSPVFPEAVYIHHFHELHAHYIKTREHLFTVT